MESKVPSGNSQYRKRRVKRLKRLIVGFVLTMIFLPLTLSIYFGCKVHALNVLLDKANEELNYYLELQSESVFSEQITEDEIVSFDVEEKPEPSHAVDKTVLSQSDVDRLSLSDEELYDGYRKVYLTFDDGPSPNTSRILDILNQYDVKGTFFVVRRDGRNIEKLYRRIVDEGHSLGMHSCTHIYRDLYANLDSFNEDTEELRNFLYMVTGVESDIYRFPGGSSNRVSKTDMHIFAKALEEKGIEFFDWNVSSQDATSIPASKEQIVKEVTGKITRYDNVIVLFHDLDSKDTTVDALPEIIEYIQALDNTVILPVTKETSPIQHLSADE